jgi:hypothetical protein
MRFQLDQRERDPNGRRIAKLAIAPELLLSMLVTLGDRRITQVGLPCDVRLLSTYYNPRDDHVVLTLEHESFEVVAHGAIAPYIEVTLTDHGPWEIPESA